MTNTFRIFGLMIFFTGSMLQAVDYDQLKVKSYKHWDLYLHENQCYLGRTFAQLKPNEGAQDFIAIQGEAREEFFKIGKEINAVLNTLFRPDKMNYAVLNNDSEKIQVHFVPRYSQPREFLDVLFTDLYWHQNDELYDRSFALDEAALFKIRDVLMGNLRLLDEELN